MPKRFHETQLVFNWDKKNEFMILKELIIFLLSGTNLDSHHFSCLRAMSRYSPVIAIRSLLKDSTTGVIWVCWLTTVEVDGQSETDYP